MTGLSPLRPGRDASRRMLRWLLRGRGSVRVMKGLGMDMPLIATRHEVFFLKRPMDVIPGHPVIGDLVNMGVHEAGKPRPDPRRRRGIGNRGQPRRLRPEAGDGLYREDVESGGETGPGAWRGQSISRATRACTPTRRTATR